MVTFEKEIEQIRGLNAKNIMLSGCLYNRRNDRCIKVQFERDGFFVLADFVIDLAKKISQKDYLKIRQRYRALHLEWYNQIRMTDYNLDAMDKEHALLFAVVAFLEDFSNADSGVPLFDNDITNALLPYIQPLFGKLRAANVTLNSID